VNGEEKVTDTRLGDLGQGADNNQLVLANELNQEKQWNGTYYLVALYNKAFDLLDVKKNYEAGFGEVHFSADLPIQKTNTTYYKTPFVRTDQGIIYGTVEEFMIQNVLDFEFDGSDSLEMAIVPNPSHGSFVLSFEDGSNEVSEGVVMIADMSGQIIFEDHINLGENLNTFEKTYELGDLMRSGLYSVILILGAKSKAQRMVILTD